MDRKTIEGLVLIIAIFIGYVYWTKPTAEEIAQQQHIADSINFARLEEQRIADSLSALQAQRDSLLAIGDSSMIISPKKELPNMGAFNTSTTGECFKPTVKTDLLRIDFNTEGGQVDRVVLSDYMTFDSNDLVLITPSDENMNLVFSTEGNRVVNTKDLIFKPFINGQPWQSPADTLTLSSEDSAVVAMRAYIDSLGSQYLEYRYTLRGNSYEVGFDIDFSGVSQKVEQNTFMDFHWQNRMNRQEKVNSGSRGKSNRNNDRESFYSGIFYKNPSDKNPDKLALDISKDRHSQVKVKLDWIAFKQQYFAAIMTAEGGIPFENADVNINTDRTLKTPSYLTDMSAVVRMTYNPEQPQIHLGYYYGPTKLRDLRSFHRGYDRMLPLGWTFISKSISRWLIVPVFNFLERFNWNYGIIIIVFTILIRLILLPLVYKSYQGGAIMKVLKPEMDALNKKYPNPEQAMQKQQQMMQLQRRAGYNPMVGCLPVLIQMPFLTAMFMFFPIAIELRQKPFLWCNDLSNYDSILDFGFNIPFYGDHISLFCLLMFGMQFFYTWYTMRQQAGSQQVPGMKFMMYFMPFMMLFIFNSQSAGLNLYYLMSLTFTMTVMMLIRRFTSEKKVRARMAAYDKKQASNKPTTKKKSNFQRRFEELQKQAERMQREQKR